MHFNYDTKFFEAISIQLALSELIKSLCSSAKTGLSVALFEYIVDVIIPKHPNARLIFAQAWPKMSGILTTKFDFSTLEYDSGVLVLKENKNSNTSVFRLNDRPFIYDSQLSQMICYNKELPDLSFLEMLAEEWQHLHDAIHPKGDKYCFTFKYLHPHPQYDNYYDDDYDDSPY